MQELVFGRRGLLAGSAALLMAPQVGLAKPAPAAPASGSGGQSAVIDVNRAQIAPIPIAIPVFAAAGGKSGELAKGIVGVISNDLSSCGLFRPLDPASFVQAAASIGAVPKWQDWKVIGARALVTGKVEQPAAGNVRVEFRLWDVLPEKQLQGTAYTTTTSNWRRVGHMIADVIYERLLGETGYFDTRIAFVSEVGPRAARIRRLAIMDQDGYNPRFLTSGRWMALDPRFRPIKNELAFMSYAQNQPRVYLLDLGSGRESLLGAFQGMTFAPRFSPHGSKVILSEAHGSGSAIVVVTLAGMRATRLTDSEAINTSPCYSPDGTHITFNSDRDGSPQLYVMGADGSSPKRISYGQGRYFSPVWSPRGDLIAFIRQNGGTFGLGVMNTDGTGQRILSEAFGVDGPAFCPNGRVIIFSRTTPAVNAAGAGHSTHLVSIDITGFNERMVQTPTDASDPAWSPLLS
ncbi:MAG: Tol-Pal system beta propeller repeat protein TolB [Rhodospirillales bacterium]|nr:Tol-Pal system beta propeller repeat protein TolB [Rhodospirillales bacterium]